MAGILHILIPNEKIYNHLSGNNIFSVLKAALFGVPLPICSCGVIPVAAHLRKQGAGKAPTLTFLISTPTSGIDSILATYSLLGPLFAIIKPISAFFGGLLAGIITNIAEKTEKTEKNEKEDKKDKENIELKHTFHCPTCMDTTPHSHTLSHNIKKIFEYAMFELVEDVGKWLIIGIVAGGLIATIFPTNIIEEYLGKAYLAYPLMLLIGIPMYVCATGSIPIAASLIMKGMSPGAGLIFLITGPATNTATLSFVAGKLGKKIVFIYLISIIITALLFAFIIDYIWLTSGKDINLIRTGMTMLPDWLKIGTAILLIILMIKPYVFKKTGKIIGKGIILKVTDMDCSHCVKTIDNVIRKLDNVEKVIINLDDRQIEIIGDVPKELIISTMKEVGFTPQELNLKN